MTTTTMAHLKNLYINYAHTLDGQMKHPEVREEEFVEALLANNDAVIAKNTPQVPATDEVREERLREVARLWRRVDTLYKVRTTVPMLSNNIHAIVFSEGLRLEEEIKEILDSL